MKNFTLLHKEFIYHIRQYNYGKKFASGIFLSFILRNILTDNRDLYLIILKDKNDHLIPVFQSNSCVKRKYSTFFIYLSWIAILSVKTCPGIDRKKCRFDFSIIA